MVRNYTLSENKRAAEVLGIEIGDIYESSDIPSVAIDFQVLSRAREILQDLTFAVNIDAKVIVSMGR